MVPVKEGVWLGSSPFGKLSQQAGAGIFKDPLGELLMPERIDGVKTRRHDGYCWQGEEKSRHMSASVDTIGQAGDDYGLKRIDRQRLHDTFCTESAVRRYVSRTDNGDAGSFVILNDIFRTKEIDGIERLNRSTGAVNI